MLAKLLMVPPANRSWPLRYSDPVTFSVAPLSTMKIPAPPAVMVAVLPESMVNTPPERFSRLLAPIVKVVLCWTLISPALAMAPVNVRGPRLLPGSNSSIPPVRLLNVPPVRVSTAPSLPPVLVSFTRPLLFSVPVTDRMVALVWPSVSLISTVPPD